MKKAFDTKKCNPGFPGFRDVQVKATIRGQENEAHRRAMRKYRVSKPPEILFVMLELDRRLAVHSQIGGMQAVQGAVATRAYSRAT